MKQKWSYFFDSTLFSLLTKTKNLVPRTLFSQYHTKICSFYSLETRKPDLYKPGYRARVVVILLPGYYYLVGVLKEINALKLKEFQIQARIEPTIFMISALPTTCTDPKKASSNRFYEHYFLFLSSNVDRGPGKRGQ